MTLLCCVNLYHSLYNSVNIIYKFIFSTFIFYHNCINVELMNLVVMFIKSISQPTKFSLQTQTSKQLGGRLDLNQEREARKTGLNEYILNTHRKIHILKLNYNNTKVFLSTIPCLIQHRILFIHHFVCHCIA